MDGREINSGLVQWLQLLLAIIHFHHGGLLEFIYYSQGCLLPSPGPIVLGRRYPGPHSLGAAMPWPRPLGATNVTINAMPAHRLSELRRVAWEATVGTRGCEMLGPVYLLCAAAKSL